MGQFKPMPKMQTTEPSVELRLKKGGSVTEAKAEMIREAKLEKSFKQHEKLPASKGHAGLKTGGVVKAQGGFKTGGVAKAQGGFKAGGKMCGGKAR